MRAHAFCIYGLENISMHLDACVCIMVHPLRVHASLSLLTYYGTSLTKSYDLLAMIRRMRQDVVIVVTQECVCSPLLLIFTLF